MINNNDKEIGSRLRQVAPSLRGSEQDGARGVSAWRWQARIGVAMGEMQVGASRRAQELRDRVKWLGDEAKRWLWRDAG